MKNVSELSSTTNHYYNADSCNEERTAKDMSMDTCNNDSDEDVIVDDDDSIKMTNYAKKRKYEENLVGSSRYVLLRDIFQSARLQLISK